MDGGGAQTPSLSSPLKKDEKTAPATFMRRDLYFFFSRGIFLRFPVFSLRGNNGNKRGEERRKEKKGLKTQFSDPFSWVGRPVFFLWAPKLRPRKNLLTLRTYFAGEEENGKRI